MRGNRNNAGRREVLQRRCPEDCGVESLFIPETIAGGHSKTAWNPRQLLGSRDLRANINGIYGLEDKMRKFPRKQNFKKGSRKCNRMSKSLMTQSIKSFSKLMVLQNRELLFLKKQNKSNKQNHSRKKKTVQSQKADFPD